MEEDWESEKWSTEGHFGEWIAMELHDCESSPGHPSEHLSLAHFWKFGDIRSSCETQRFECL
jgi:hypothetical protein